MIVGSKEIPKNNLVVACRSCKEVIKFAESLVPKFIRHNKEVIDNQRYLVALELRELREIPYNRKVKLIEALLSGIRVRGTINRLVDINDLLLEVNMDLLLSYLFKEELENLHNRKHEEF